MFDPLMQAENTSSGIGREVGKEGDCCAGGHHFSWEVVQTGLQVHDHANKTRPTWVNKGKLLPRGLREPSSIEGRHRAMRRLQSCRQEPLTPHRLRHFRLCTTKSKARAWLRSPYRARSWETLPVRAVQPYIVSFYYYTQRMTTTACYNGFSPAVRELA